MCFTWIVEEDDNTTKLILLIAAKSRTFSCDCYAVGERMSEPVDKVYLVFQKKYIA